MSTNRRRFLLAATALALPGLASAQQISTIPLDVGVPEAVAPEAGGRALVAADGRMYRLFEWNTDPVVVAGTGVASIGVKLYTMHWPMILRSTCDALVTHAPALAHAAARDTVGNAAPSPMTHSMSHTAHRRWSGMRFMEWGKATLQALRR